MNPLIQSWLLQSLVIFLIVGSLAGLAVGALLVLRPQSVPRLSVRFNRWISSRHLEQPLERSISLDPWAYRFHRVGGTLTLLGSLYILYFFTVSLDRPVAVGMLANQFKLPSAFVAALLDATVLSALAGAVFAAVVSLFLLMRPSLLRGFEQGANQWLSLRRAMKPVEIERGGLDAYVMRYGRQAGILLVLGSIYTLVLMTMLLSHLPGA